MRKGRNLRITLFVAIMVIIAVMSTILVACKPGYKETWDPIAPYSYEWDSTNGDIEIISQRINQAKLAEMNAERKKIDEDNAIKAEKGEKVNPNPMDPEYILSNINEDGTFKNIDYNSDSNTYWAPLDQLKNALYLQVAYNTEGDEYYHDPKVKDAVNKTMKNWAVVGYHCDWNWWYNDVGVGMYSPNIMLLGVDGLTEEETNKLLKDYEKTLLHTQPMRFRLYERKCNQAGGNLTDQALATLKYCCVVRDGNTIKWVTEQIENELRFFPDFNKKHHRWDAEGIKEDYSFQQHDQLIYFGGYGEVFLKGLSQYLDYTRDTQFAIKGEKLDFLTDFLIEGIQFSTRGGYRDISASGRGIARPNSLGGIYNQVKMVANSLLEYDTISTASRDKLTNLLETRYVSPETDQGAGGHRYFYKSDYNVMNNNKYMATVRHASKNTRVFEVLNGENAKGYWTGFGASFFYVDGDEYNDALPAWDWNKIPGTTVKQSKKTPQVQEWYSYDRYGKTPVNGVSNKKVGVSHLNMKDKGVNALKSYFMFEDGVVCLGTDIWSLNYEETYTTINQVRKDGDVVAISGDSQEIVPLGSNKTLTVDAIYHDKVAYLSNDEITLSVNTQKGDLKDLNLRQTKSDVRTCDMVQLGISHGKWPIGKDYAYTVLMNTTIEDTKAYKANPYLKIVENNKKVQAVEDTKNNVAEAIFHKDAKITLLGQEVEVKGKGCLIMEKVGDKIIVTVSSYDAAKDNKMKISINGSGVDVTLKQAPTTLTF